MEFSVAILIVSTTAAADPSTDASAGLLTDFFSVASDGKVSWKVAASKIVSDDAVAIQRAVEDWADVDKHNLIVTTGGTGFAVSDVTPEAVKPLLRKEAPGLVHAMLATSLSITPFAVMSRPVAGVRGQSIIVTVPGSPKGAKENLESLIRLLPHACLQAAGASSRALHSGGVKGLEKQHGVQREHRLHSPREELHHHYHSHSHSHDHRSHKVPQPRTTPEQRTVALGEAVTRRHRESPYPMLSVPECNDIIAEQTPLGKIIEATVSHQLVGHVLAADVTAQEAVPAFRASIIDGYAVHHEDVPGTYPVVSVSHAAPGAAPPLERGQIARITTGAPLPPGATAAVMVEDTVLKSMTPDEKEEHEVEILAPVIAPSENVREIGSDVALGSVVLEEGALITGSGGEIGLLASVGVRTVKVFQMPVVGVMSTGDEVVKHDVPRPLQLGEIRDSNRPALLTAINSHGFPSVDLGIAADRPWDLASELRDNLAKVDVIITTGGISMGELDLLKPTIEQALGGTIHFGRVAVKPGKPTTFATVPPSKDGAKRKLIFALPGNPASALVTFHLFVLPSLRKYAGYGDHKLPRVRVTAGQDFRLDPRPEYHRVYVTMGQDGRLYATSTGGQRSSRIGSTAAANAVVCLPAKGDVSRKRADVGVIPKGETVDAILWGQIGGIAV